MGKEFTIGELAKAADVPTSTVRYYERAGILRPSGRSAGNYRVYSEAELERLRFIRAAQATGFTLDDIKALLRPAACTTVQSLIEERLEQVAERLSELRRVQRVLKGALAECLEHEQSGRCRVIETLSAAAGSKRRSS